jgi:hypothetical protein
LLEEVMAMKSTLFLALSAASVFAIGAAQAQDRPPAQDASMQLDARGEPSAAPNDTAYGGARPASMSGNPSLRDARAAGADRPCTPGLDCDIYRGQ